MPRHRYSAVLKIKMAEDDQMPDARKRCEGYKHMLIEFVRKTTRTGIMSTLGILVKNKTLLFLTTIIADVWC